MSSANSNDSSAVVPDYRLSYAHGTVMVLSWMLFASTGILSARYGRSLRIGIRRKLFGESLWFQAHRLTLTIAAFSTLLGFLLILSQAGGTWVSLQNDGPYLFAHSILGIFIVGFALIQICMALFRCHPDGHFRFIFNWAHRTVGILAFILSIPTIFIIITILTKYQSGLYVIISLWTGWIVVVVIIFEVLERLSHQNSRSSPNQAYRHETEHELRASNSTPDNATHYNIHQSEGDRFNRVRLILLGVHVIISTGLVIAFIVLIWQQN